MKNLVVKTDKGDIQIKGNDFVVATTGFDKTKETLESRLKLIYTSYSIRQNIGIPWLDYLHNSNIEVRHEYIMSYLYNEIIQTEGINPESINIEHVGTTNRTSTFRVECTYGVDNSQITINLRG